MNLRATEWSREYLHLPLRCANKKGEAEKNVFWSAEKINEISKKIVHIMCSHMVTTS